MTTAIAHEPEVATSLSWRRVSPLLVLRVRGSQEEMGTAHGRLLRISGDIGEARDFYRALPERLLFNTGSRLDAIARLATAPGFELLLRRLDGARPRALRDRTRAFFEAAGLSQADARFVCVMDLFQNLVGLAGKVGLVRLARTLGAQVPPACSTLQAWGRATTTGELLHARNFDFPGIGVWDRAPTLVFCEPDRGLRYAFVTTRGADTPGVTAFNEAGLVVTVHTRLHRDVRFDGACVSDLGHEIVRRASTLDEAVAVARERPVSSTWGVAISSGRERRALSLETTGRAIEVVSPSAGNDFLGTTNHYQHPAQRRGELAPSPAWHVHSRARLRRLEAEARAGVDADALERLLGCHDDTDDPGASRAAGSVVSQPATVQSVVIAPEQRTVRVSTGGCPAGWGPYVEAAWSWEGPELEERVPERDVASTARFVRGEAGEAYGAFLEAARAFTDGRDARRAFAAIERAVALDPDEPRYRYFAGVLALKHGQAPRALEHLERGLVTEGAAFRRGNLLLFASRAASLAGDEARARRHRQTLLATTEAALAEHRRAATREQVRPLGQGALARLVVNFLLADSRC